MPFQAAFKERLGEFTIVDMILVVGPNEDG